jgi:hypothetical protein
MMGVCFDIVTKREKRKKKDLSTMTRENAMHLGIKEWGESLKRERKAMHQQLTLNNICKIEETLSQKPIAPKQM